MGTPILTQLEGIYKKINNFFYHKNGIADTSLYFTLLPLGDFRCQDPEGENGCVAGRTLHEKAATAVREEYRGGIEHYGGKEHRVEGVEPMRVLRASGLQEGKSNNKSRGFNNSTEHDPLLENEVQKNLENHSTHRLAHFTVDGQSKENYKMEWNPDTNMYHTIPKHRRPACNAESCYCSDKDRINDKCKNF